MRRRIEATHMSSAKRPAWLLTTRRRVAVALGVTAFLFALSVRDELHPAYRNTSWVFPDGVPHRWLAIAFGVAIYGFYCWMSFEAIRATKGRERLFMVGLLLGFMPSPVKTLRPLWAVPVEDLEFFGITISLVAALSLLLFPEVAGSASAPSAPES
jgi:hypothetical protein